MNKIGFYLGLPFLILLGILPFWMIYGLSDLTYLLIRLSGYRKKVVYTNLRNAFPEKKEEEIKNIANKFYSHFCDIFLETLKLQFMSEKTIRKRVTPENVELLERYYHEGKDVVAVVGHYGNWEWVASMNLFITAQGCQTYHPLKNKQFDRFMLKLRARWGSRNFTMKDTFKEIVRMRMQNKRYVIGLISDQTPGRKRIQYFNRFLNQDTPIHLGAEKIAVKTNSPVVFFRFDKLKRGYYKLSVHPLVENPKDSAQREITDIHTKFLEKIIKEKPEYWLWSHRRWKHQPHNTKLLDV